MHRTQAGWIEVYQKKDALWIYDGNPKRPHARLTSDNHSNGFFNSKFVIPDDQLLMEAASDLVELFGRRGGLLLGVGCVVGPQTGATKLAAFMSRKITELTDGYPCQFASPAKHEEDGKKSMLFSAEDTDRVRGKTVLLCEDVLTTGGSVDLATAATMQAGGSPLPFILVLVNRSGLTEVHGKKIIGLIEHSMPVWTPEECPLCKGGSEALRPKDNWAALNASY